MSKLNFFFFFCIEVKIPELNVIGSLWIRKQSPVTLHLMLYGMFYLSSGQLWEQATTLKPDYNEVKHCTKISLLHQNISYEKIFLKL